jgi:prepilin-type processing-associated H-X9-DG protein
MIGGRFQGRTARNAVFHNRHSDRFNFLFADGSIRIPAVEKAFAPSLEIDFWHPRR